ncbi:MAG: NRDE family protein [Deltaproteobacteria bacterium]|nr:NRDE family protein [Deltaproteobacteria bacterium]
MCLILLAYKTHPAYRLILAANRDEFYSRPTEPLAFRGTNGSILCGEDREGGGTWLAMSTTGRIAAITNFRGHYCTGTKPPSRGLLVTSCVTARKNLRMLLQEIAAQSRCYNGFNLLAGDSESLYYLSNRKAGIHPLDPGIYGLSNHFLDTPWPKITTGKARFNDFVNGGAQIDTEALFQLLHDRTLPTDQQLPDTGVGMEWEKILAPLFIESDIYGTRTTSIILISTQGQVNFLERTHSITGTDRQEKTREYTFSINAQQR